MKKIIFVLLLLAVLLAVIIASGYISSKDEIDKKFSVCEKQFNDVSKYDCMVLAAIEIANKSGTEKGLEACDRIKEYAENEGSMILISKGLVAAESCKQRIEK